MKKKRDTEFFWYTKEQSRKNKNRMQCEIEPNSWSARRKMNEIDKMSIHTLAYSRQAKNLI